MLNILFNYRENSYFNSNDSYIIKCPFGYTVSKLQFNKSNWYSIEQLCYKMSSIECINCNDLIGEEVIHRKTNLKGRINKFTKNSIGVFWFDNQNIKDKHLSYWNEIYDLNSI